MNSSQQTANNTIDLHRLMMLCRKHIKMLIIWTLLAGVLGYVVAQFVVVPKYTATTEILVNQKHENNDNGQAYNRGWELTINSWFSNSKIRTTIFDRFKNRSPDFKLFIKLVANRLID